MIDGNDNEKIYIVSACKQFWKADERSSQSEYQR